MLSNFSLTGGKTEKKAMSCTKTSRFTIVRCSPGEGLDSGPTAMATTLMGATLATVGGTERRITGGSPCPAPQSTEVTNTCSITIKTPPSQKVFLSRYIRATIVQLRHLTPG